MKRIENIRNHYVLFAAAFLAACAGTASVIAAPQIDLTRVELTSANFRQQTFLLSFDVSNPNPFPLPVRAVEYRVMLDNEKFAGGETQGSFTVPARGDDSFAFSVDLDFLSSATHLRSLLRGGLQENVRYELKGRLTIDIPLVKPIPFSSSGVINITQTASDQFE